MRASIVSISIQGACGDHGHGINPAIPETELRHLADRYGDTGETQARELLSKRGHANENKQRRAEAEADKSSAERRQQFLLSKQLVLSTNAMALKGPDPYHLASDFCFHGWIQKLKALLLVAFQFVCVVIAAGELVLSTAAVQMSGLPFVSSGAVAFSIGFLPALGLFIGAHFLLEYASERAGKVWSGRLESGLMLLGLPTVLLFCLTYPVLCEPREFGDDLPWLPSLWLTVFTQMVFSSATLAAGGRILRSMTHDLRVVRLTRNEADAFLESIEQKQNEISTALDDCLAAIAAASGTIQEMDACIDDFIESGMTEFDRFVVERGNQARLQELMRQRDHIDRELRVFREVPGIVPDDVEAAEAG